MLQAWLSAPLVSLLPRLQGQAREPEQEHEAFQPCLPMPTGLASWQNIDLCFSVCRSDHGSRLLDDAHDLDRGPGRNPGLCRGDLTVFRDFWAGSAVSVACVGLAIYPVD